jgi:pantoate kinase
MAREKIYKSEKDVKTEIKRLLKHHGWFFWMPPMNGYGASGVSDILAIRDGVFLAIEAKFGANKPSALQKSFLESVMAESGFGFVVNDKTVGALQTWLEAFDRATMAAGVNTKPLPEDGAAMLDAIRIMTEAVAS